MIGGRGGRPAFPGSDIQVEIGGEGGAVLDEAEAGFGLVAHQPLDRIAGGLAVIAMHGDAQGACAFAGAWWFP